MLYYFSFVPEVSPLQTETCGNVKCDIVILISKEQLLCILLV